MYLISRIAGKAIVSRVLLLNKSFHRCIKFHNFPQISPIACQGHAVRWFSVDNDRNAEEIFKAVTESRKESSSNEEKSQDPGQQLGSGEMIQLNNFKKYLLMMSGRWKKFADIPDVLPESRYDSDLWVTRIRIASIMMILWVVTAILTSLWGKQARNERTHQVVLKQYWDSLSDEEKEEFIKEYNINPETIK